MPSATRRPTVPMALWAMLIWGGAAFTTLRGYSGIPGMPTGLPSLPAWCWALIAGSAVAGFAACTQVRRRPLLALYVLVVAAVVLVLAVGTQGISGLPEPMLGYFLITADLALGRIVATRPPRVWWVAAAPLLAAQPVSAALRAAFRQPDPAGWIGWELNGAVWLAYAVLPALVAGLIGYSIRQAREYAERLSEQAAAQAVVAERLRISRELHDHVAHSVGVIALQAGAAARVMDSQPDRAREAMHAIELTSRDTLSGLRRLVGGLRPAQAAPVRPAPGLADLDSLAATTTAAGVSVDLRWSGDRRALPADVELSAYRIVQESLTNVLRHAKAGACRVSVGYRPAELVIEVVDEGRGTGSSPGHQPAPGTGYGLIGLRERVALMHGTMTAGPRDDGGFRVAARLPLEPGVAT